MIVSSDAASAASIQMAAAIALKNACSRYWGKRLSGVMPDFLINDTDKAFLRDSLLGKDTYFNREDSITWCVVTWT